MDIVEPEEGSYQYLSYLPEKALDFCAHSEYDVVVGKFGKLQERFKVETTRKPEANESLSRGRHGWGCFFGQRFRSSSFCVPYFSAAGASIFA
jgi:hypothetical protein